MEYAFILGGTRGLGLSLAHEAHTRGIVPIVSGRSLSDRLPSGAEFLNLDLADVERLAEASEKLGALQQKNRIEYFFWVAGIFLKGPFRETTQNDIGMMVDTHIAGPLNLLREFHVRQTHPYRLIVIASSSSWRLRDNEMIYCGMKAAKAALTRQFSVELARDLPGSKTTLFNPGGMKTPNFWKKSGQNIDDFMDPTKVARAMWNAVASQQKSFEEFQIMRGSGGAFSLTAGPRLPELPA